MKDLLLLGIDTSGKNASASILDTDTEIFIAQKTLYTQKTHSQVIMPIVSDIISLCGKTVSDIGAIAVANGPGSYTGLRIGAAAVKALGFGLGVKCCGVSTLESLAYNNIAYIGTICSVMKARGELVYCAVYNSDGYCLERVSDEKLMSRDELAMLLALRGESVLLCGDGSADFFTDYRSARFTIAPPQARLQNASGVCLAALSKELVDPEELEVAYLQRVKAEKDLEEKSGK